MFALSANISEIGKKVLLAGAKKDVLESARQEIVTRHEAGEKITLAQDEKVDNRKAPSLCRKTRCFSVLGRDRLVSYSIRHGVSRKVAIQE